MPPSPKKPPELIRLLRSGTPLLDVRAPAEYDKGALPHSTNLPILTDAERARVGTTYKHAGREAAVALGHKMVNGAVKAERVAAWLAFIDAHPEAQVMCWRGGLRSRLAQQWLAEAGCDIARVEGGYKTLRQLCLDTLAHAPQQHKSWWVIGGRTGVRKTVLIEQLPFSIDLEGLAHHRGSAFGAFETPQPNPASFENHLACSFLQHQQPILAVEDESRTIGRLAIPQAWHEHMQQAPLALIEADLDSRIEHIVMEYVTQPLANGEALGTLELRYRDALKRISRRLGGLLFSQIEAALSAAFNGSGSHAAWVSALLRGYYDPMYDYQLSRKQARVRFRGDLEAVRAFMLAQAQSQPS